MGWYDGMQPDFAKRLEAMIAASGGRLGVGSGYRSIEEQTALWEASDKTGYWVAAPGKSNHNHGIAADLAYNTDDAQSWAHQNAARFGLAFPMEWEPWHIEPSGARETADPGAYTIPPNGYLPVQDPARRGTLEYQLQSLNDLLMQTHTPTTEDVIGAQDAQMLGSPDAASGEPTASAAAPEKTVFEGQDS